jgi:integrase
MRTRKGFLEKRGNTFHAVWTVNGKRFRKSTHCTTERKAQKVLDKIMEPFLVENRIATLQHIKSQIDSEKDQLTALDEQRHPALTIALAWQNYLEAPNRPDTGQSTLDQYAFQFGWFVKWLNKNHPEVTLMQAVTPAIAAAFAANLIKDGRSANTYNKYLNLLTLVFRILKKEARLAMNPWEDIQRKRIVSQGRRELTLAELQKVCEKATGEMRLLLAIGIYTGLRLGDCATLRWCEVDLLRGIILRIPNKTGRRNPKPVQVPIHATLGAMLADIPAHTRKVYVLPQTADSYHSRSDTITDQVQRLFEKCGILTHKPGTGIEKKEGVDGQILKVDSGKRAVIETGFHSLRHTFVSLCRAANAPLSVVESIVGHSSPAMTRHYTHTGIDAATAAVAALPAITGEPVKILPPVLSIRMVDAEVVLALAKGMTGKNWKEKQLEIIKLASPKVPLAVSVGQPLLVGHS